MSSSTEMRVLHTTAATLPGTVCHSALTHYRARRGANYIDFSRDRFGSGAANVGQVQKFGAALAFGAFAALGLGMTFSGESTAAMGQRRKMSKKV